MKADDLGGEEVGAGELFFSGVAACAVNMVERIAAADETPLEWMDVSVEAYRDPVPPGPRGVDPLRFGPGPDRNVGRERRRRRSADGVLEGALSPLRHGRQPPPRASSQVQTFAYPQGPPSSRGASHTGSRR